jgi:hypothetical protein
VRLGLLICYDIRFPEVSRALALLEGCDVLLHPSAFPKDQTYASWPLFVVTRAIENQVYVLSLSRAGAHFGGSLLCPPWPSLSPQALASLGAPGTLAVTQTGALDMRDDEAKPIVRLADGEGVLHLSVDTIYLQRVRRQYPYRMDAHAALRVTFDPSLTAPGCKSSECVSKGEAPPATLLQAPAMVQGSKPVFASSRMPLALAGLALCGIAAGCYWLNLRSRNHQLTSSR